MLFIFVVKYKLLVMASKQMAFRFDEELIALIKEKAQAQKRSLNNYIEFLLHKDVGNIPNDETIKAIEEARNLTEDKAIKDLDSFLNDL